MHRLHVDTEPLPHPSRDGQRPGRVHRGAERRVQHDSPVAELVAETFDHDGPVVRQGAGRLPLFGKVGEQVVGRPRSSPAVESRCRACGSGIAEISRRNAPWARPSSTGRPRPSPFQNGSRPGRPGAGSTSTRSWVMSVISQDVEPRAKTSPTRDSYTISSSSSPTRRPGPSPPARKTPNMPRSGMVPPELIASRAAPGRPVSSPVARSQTSRGRSSANSSLG